MEREEPNPYDVLGVAPTASNAEIIKAFAMAIQRRNYSADAIAKARKSLMNPQERLVADYLRPQLPQRIPPFEVEDLSDLENLELNFTLLSQWDGLDRAIANASSVTEIDQRVGAKLLS
ncbi:molecular chaperone DnaJ [Lusitaniella coriacea LEGE 07157]|uniref:Molecular chaperone DnaJ n=1 Tax=Lusitaniella coriacea LEGE 07157 TaxID=945747 RepID=A0A8J7DX81_9CYAN|nr:molecular chaperone DnaJ [Lusitaniella coriacea]MBE9116949.1 molecular chaperone DnaJ [Lusitaniella coriacea LEGE 07157]